MWLPLIRLALTIGLAWPAMAIAQEQNPRNISEEAYQRFRAGDKLGAAQIFGEICNQGNNDGCEFEAVAIYSAVDDVYAATSGANINGVESNCSDFLNVDQRCAGPVAQAVAMLQPMCLKAAKRGTFGPRVGKACGSWIQMRKHLKLIQDPAGALGIGNTASEDPSENDSSSGTSSQTPAPAVSRSGTSASSGPILLVRATLGTGCVTGQLTQVRRLPTGWEGVWVLRNKCATRQIVAIEGGGGLAVAGWPALWNLGAWSPALPKRPPALPFTPVPMTLSDGTTYSVDANGRYESQLQPLSWNEGDPPFEAWIASCAAYAPDGAKQVMYRSATRLTSAPQIACVPAN